MSRVYFGPTIDQKSGIVTQNGAIYGYASSSTQPYGSGGAWHTTNTNTATSYNNVYLNNEPWWQRNEREEREQKMQRDRKEALEKEAEEKRILAERLRQKRIQEEYEAEEYRKWFQLNKCTNCDGIGEVYHFIHSCYDCSGNGFIEVDENVHIKCKLESCNKKQITKTVMNQKEMNNKNYSLLRKINNDKECMYHNKTNFLRYLIKNEILDENYIYSDKALDNLRSYLDTDLVKSKEYVHCVMDKTYGKFNGLGKMKTVEHVSILSKMSSIFTQCWVIVPCIYTKNGNIDYGSNNIYHDTGYGAIFQFRTENKQKIKKFYFVRIDNQLPFLSINIWDLFKKFSLDMVKYKDYIQEFSLPDCTCYETYEYGCNACNGNGYNVEKQKVNKPCTRCNGNGKGRDQFKNCPSCNGSKINKKQ